MRVLRCVVLLRHSWQRFKWGSPYYDLDCRECRRCGRFEVYAFGAYRRDDPHRFPDRVPA